MILQNNQKKRERQHRLECLYCLLNLSNRKSKYTQGIRFYNPMIENLKFTKAQGNDKLKCQGQFMKPVIVIERESTKWLQTYCKLCIHEQRTWELPRHLTCPITWGRFRWTSSERIVNNRVLGGAVRCLIVRTCSQMTCQFIKKGVLTQSIKSCLGNKRT